MIKVKKSILCGLSCVLLFCIGLCFAGCGDTKDKKYDVTIKIKNNYGNEWIFTPDIQELHYEFEYTGEDMTFYIDSYNLADHPDWGDKWLGLTGEGANVFQTSLGKVNQKYDEENPKSVCEKGEYIYYCTADSTSNLWNFRSVRLYITVK